MGDGRWCGVAVRAWDGVAAKNIYERLLLSIFDVNDIERCYTGAIESKNFART
jgi:hypothetical protein